jgi:hypothetical protein
MKIARQIMTSCVSEDSLRRSALIKQYRIRDKEQGRCSSDDPSGDKRRPQRPRTRFHPAPASPAQSPARVTEGKSPSEPMRTTGGLIGAGRSFEALMPYRDLAITALRAGVAPR